MDTKPALQNIQDSFLNTARKEKAPITIYLLSGVKLTGRIRSFDKYSVVLDTNNQEQLIFKHAISTVVLNKGSHHGPHTPGAGGSRNGSRGGVTHSRPHSHVVEDPSQRRERAFLIGIDSGRRPRPLQQAKAARNAAATSSRKSSEKADVSPELPFSAEDSIAELQELATSAGAEVVGQFLQRKEKPDPATLIGSGKLEEIAGAAASAQADLILFDHDLSPSQQRNIEKDP